MHEYIEEFHLRDAMYPANYCKEISATRKVQIKMGGTMAGESFILFKRIEASCRKWHVVWIKGNLQREVSKPKIFRSMYSSFLESAQRYCQLSLERQPSKFHKSKVCFFCLMAMKILSNFVHFSVILKHI